MSVPLGGLIQAISGHWRALITDSQGKRFGSCAFLLSSSLKPFANVFVYVGAEGDQSL